MRTGNTAHHSPFLRLLALTVAAVILLPCLVASAGSNIGVSVSLTNQSVQIVVTNSTDYVTWVRLFDNSGNVNVDYMEIGKSSGAILRPTKSGSFCYEVTVQDNDTGAQASAKTSYFTYSVAEETEPELDMSGAYLNKETYNPGDTIKIYGIKYKNATYVSITGSLSAIEGVTINTTSSSSWKTLSAVSIIIPSTTTKTGNFYFSVKAFDDYGSWTTTDSTTLQYTLEAEKTDLPELDMSGAYLDKSSYNPGGEITIKGIKYKNATRVNLSASGGITWASYKSVGQASAWATLSPVTLTLSKEEAAGKYYISVYAKNANGTTDTDSTTLTFTITSQRALELLSVVSDKVSAKVGDTVTWTAESVGGAGGNRYLSYLYKGTTVMGQTAYATTNTFTYTFTEAGTYYVKGYVKDSESTLETCKSVNFTVTEPVTAPVVTAVTPNKASAEIGDTVTWTAQASGGAGGNSFRFYLYNGNTIIKKSAYGTASTFSYTLPTSGAYAVRAYVMDSSGATDNLMGGYVSVSPGSPVVETVTPSKSAAVIGDTVTWTAQASSGTGGNQYRFYLYNGNTIIKKSAYGTANTFSYTLTEAGNYAVRAYVVDAKGETANLMGGYVAVTAGSPRVVSVTPNATEVAAGGTVTWTVKAAGGAGGYNYRFYLYKGNDIIKKSAYSTASNLSYTLTESGVYAVRAYVVDAKGETDNLMGGYVVVAAGALTVDSVTPSTGSAVVGGTVTWTVKAAGGAGGNQYRFYLYKGNTIMEKSAYTVVNTFSYTFSDAGTYAVRAYAADSKGAVDNLMGGYVTVSAGAPQVISVTPSKTTAVAGKTITWTVKATGGTGGYNYRFYVYKGNTIVEKSAYTANNAFSYSVSEAGVYAVRAYVVDATGAADNLMGGYVTVK